MCVHACVRIFVCVYVCTCVASSVSVSARSKQHGRQQTTKFKKTISPQTATSKRQNRNSTRPISRRLHSIHFLIKFTVIAMRILEKNHSKKHRRLRSGRTVKIPVSRFLSQVTLTVTKIESNIDTKKYNCFSMQNKDNNNNVNRNNDDKKKM